MRMGYAKILLYCVSVLSCFKAYTNTPNVILILADDMGYGDLSCYGQTKFNTPNIDKLAAAGILFTQHASGAPVCAPSRAALLTAKHTGSTTIRGNKSVNKFDFPLSDTDTTLIQLFKQAGYATGVFGKWGVGGPASTGDVLTKGADKFVGYYSQIKAHSYYPKTLWNNNEQLHFPENNHFRKQTYSPQVIHDSLLAFIDKNKSQPFLIYMPTILPHAELVPPDAMLQEHLGKYGNEKKYSGIKTIRIAKHFGAYEKQKNPKAAFATMMTLLDKQVGEIVEKLKAENLYDNTIIILTSDNGPHKEGGAQPDFFHSSGGLRGYKRDVYEGGLRVPFIVHWPDKIKSGQSDFVSANWDIMPTLMAIIQAKSPTNIDGISLLPTLLGAPEQQESHSFLYWEFHEKGGKQAIRMGDWKLIRLNSQHPKQLKVELYNIKEDQAETNNRCNQHPELVQELLQKMNAAHSPNKAFPLKMDKNKPL